MIKGQHRKMFRKPGLARQALGILASSGELMNEVQPRMRMAQAGAVNKSLFDQATRMVDGMIASGEAPAANRDAAINNLYRYYENRALTNPRPAASRMQGYMNPADAPIDTSGVRGLPSAAAQKVPGGIGSMIGGIGSMVDSFANPDSPPPGEALRPQMEEDDTRIERLAKNIGSGLLSTAQLPSNVVKGINRIGSGAVDVAVGPAEEPLLAGGLVSNANASDKKGDPPKPGKPENNQNADLLEQLEDLNKERDRLSGLIDKDEKEAIDPFLQRYKEMTGNDEDDFYQAMMTAGLAIAGGQSDDAVSNIARGALAGLQQYSKSKKDRRDSLFLAEIQARKLEAAETPATIQTLEILQDNPELQDLYSRTIGKTEKVTDKRAADAQLIAAQKAYSANNEVAGDLALQRALLMSGTDPDTNFQSMKERMQSSKASVE